MDDGWDGNPMGDRRRMRALAPRSDALRLVGLLLVVGIVVGALVMRLGDRADPDLPTLYTDSIAEETDPGGRDQGPAAVPGSGSATPTGPADRDAAQVPGPAADLAADSGATVPPPAAGSTAALDPADTLGSSAALASEPDAHLKPEPEPGPEPEPDSIYVPPVPPEGWADPTEPSPLAGEPVPDSLRVPKPETVRGVYVGSWSAGSRRRLASLLALADGTEINAFVVDIKDVTGEVSHRTEVPLALQLEADRRVRIPDIRALLDTLRAHRIYPIARIVAFKDPLLAVARPGWAVERADGTPWFDDNGVHWVDSFNRAVWDYNIELAREAVALGFAEVQWDYVRFPDVPSSYAVEAVYPAREGRTKTQAIREFLGYSAHRLAGLDVPVTADIFGITTSTNRDIGIGQVWEMMADQVDVLLPMVYPSHYPDGSWGYPDPNAAPYQIVKAALEAAVERSDTIPDAADVRPWLQAFTLGEPPYGPRHIRAQIDATYDAGLSEWVLWHPGVRYPAEAFVDANGLEPWFAGMGEMLYEPERAAPPVDTSAPQPPRR